MRSRSVFPSLVIVALALQAAGCGREAPPAREVVRPVKTVVVGGRRGGEFTFPGIVEASEKAVLSFRVHGRLQQLPIEEGQAVERGQLIGRLDPRDFEISVTQAQAEFSKAEADLERYKRLYENDAVPLADLQARRATRDVTRARLDEAHRNLSFTELYAPFAGRIGRRYVENFMDVQANQEIVDLNDVERVEIIFDVSETIVRGLRQGEARAAVYAEFDNAPGESFPLEFKEAANRADPTTQTFRVRYTMPQPEEFALLPGMTAQVRTTLETAQEVGTVASRRIYTIPVGAVTGAPDNSPYVWVVGEDMTVSQRPVRVGPLRGSDQIQILGGLEGGEEIVVAGLRSLVDGMTVSRWEPLQ